MSDTEEQPVLNGPITVLPADDPKKLRLNWIIKEEVGMVVINTYAIAAINLPDPPTPLPPDTITSASVIEISPSSFM